MAAHAFFLYSRINPTWVHVRTCEYVQKCKQQRHIRLALFINTIRHSCGLIFCRESLSPFYIKWETQAISPSFLLSGTADRQISDKRWRHWFTIWDPCTINYWHLYFCITQLPKHFYHLGIQLSCFTYSMEQSSCKVRRIVGLIFIPLLTNVCSACLTNINHTSRMRITPLFNH